MQTRVYQAGSVVYFAGDKSDRVYILKEGKAQSIFLSEETGKTGSRQHFKYRRERDCRGCCPVDQDSRTEAGGKRERAAVKAGEDPAQACHRPGRSSDGSG